MSGHLIQIGLGGWLLLGWTNNPFSSRQTHSSLPLSEQFVQEYAGRKSATKAHKKKPGVEPGFSDLPNWAE
jgi:hypothetical protein